MNKGRQRGFITESEILHTFPEVEDYLDVYNSFLDVIDHVGFQVIETREGFLGKRKEHEDNDEASRRQRAQEQREGRGRAL